MAPGAATERFPLGVRIAGIAVAGVVLTAFFLYLRFPYDRLAQRIASALEESQGVRVEMAHVGPSLRWLGPGLAVDALRVTERDGSTVLFDRAVVRPAWSFSWFSGRPAVHTDLVGPLGEADGTLTLGDPQAWDGDLRGIDLAEIPIPGMGDGSGVDGRADIEIDVTLEAEGPEGTIQFVARDGSVSHPQLPLAIPYETLEGELVLGGEHQLEIVSLDVQSPMVTGTLTGTVGHAPRPANAPLRLQATLTATPAIRGALNAQGVRVGKDGKVEITIMGTPSRPLVRSAGGGAGS